MYKLHLILKYLRKRRIAWVSLIAVMLCTAMVLVIISVMGGWLRMFRASVHGLSGDILIQGAPLTGFSGYQEMIDRVQQIDGVAAAVPTLRTFGLININNRKPQGVQVMGYPIERIGQVNTFPTSLYRQYQQYLDAANDKTSTLTAAERDALRKKADEGAAHPSFQLPFSADYYRALLPNAKTDVSKWPGMICGTGVLNIHKDKDGNLTGRGDFLYGLRVRLTVISVASGSFDISTENKSEENYWVIDDSHSKAWQYDSNTLYVPFDVLQRDMNMDAQLWTNPEGKELTQPARTHEIDVALKPGVDLDATRDKVQKVIDEVYNKLMAKASLENNKQAMFEEPDVVTWEQSNAKFIGAIENEKTLVTFLFGMVSIVAIFLIFCIFYMIVVEKTRDIGIIKSVGATSTGVAMIFLGYGLAIGMVGSGLGFAVGYFIVHNINWLHEEMGKLLHVKIWDPEVYAFDTIPNTMNPKEVALILAVGVFSSVLGALVPAIRAARMNPVEAVRFE